MKRRGGFTVVDLMVTLAILAIVLGAVFALFHSHERTVRAAEEERDLYGEAALILDRLTRDLTSAWLPASDIMGGTAKYTFTAEPNALNFTTTARLSLGAPTGSEIVEVGYRLEAGEDDASTFTLIRRQDDTVDEDPEDGGGIIVLSRNITGMTIMYADSEGQMNETHSAEKRGELPKMVAIALVLTNSNGREIPFATTVYPVLAQGVVRSMDLPESGELPQ